MYDQSSHWVVARTKPNRESWAAENIRRQGFDYYLPKFSDRKFSIREKRYTETVRALFPSYIFVWIEGPWRWLTGTFGVSSVVLVNGYPAVLPNKIVDTLRSSESRTGLILLPDAAPPPRFRLGQPVRVKEGAFSGRTGLFDGDAAERVRVLLSIMGRMTPVQIDGDFVEAA